MTTAALYKELNYVNHSREKRLHYANLVIAQPELIAKLLDILFMVNDKISPKAAWVLEFMCSKNVAYLMPHIDKFTKNMHKVHLDSAVRPVAKICEILVETYTKNNNLMVANGFKKIHKERIIATCFDFLINDEKVAPKAYAMSALYLLGKEYNWIHPELTLILERDFHAQSAAFKARAKQILRKIKKAKKS